MKGSVLLLAAVIAFGGGCRALMHMQQSSFASRFMLDKSVKATAYKGIDSTGVGAGGTLGGSTGGIGPGGRDVHTSFTSASGFTIREEGEDKFNEIEFLGELASQIRKEIAENHASITGSGTPASNEFYLEYSDGDIKGRITIVGSARGKAYSVRANVDEGNKP